MQPRGTKENRPSTRCQSGGSVQKCLKSVFRAAAALGVYWQLSKKMPNSRCAQTRRASEYLKLKRKKPDRLAGLMRLKDCNLSYFLSEQADFLCRRLQQITVILSSNKQRGKDWITSGRFVKVKVGKLWESIFYFKGSYECYHLRKCTGQKVSSLRAIYWKPIQQRSINNQFVEITFKRSSLMVYCVYRLQGRCTGLYYLS